MKRALLVILALSLITPRAFSHEDEFPDERNYIPLKDSGFGQYAAPSLRGTNKIVLTFDDGPSTSLTPLVLDILKKYGVKATFFVQGKNITDATMPIIERALREGHFVGAHSMYHLRSNDMDEEDFKSDTKETFKRLQVAIDRSGVQQNEVYYRFPFGAYGRNKSYHHFNVLRELSKEIYGDNCINFAFWSVDSADWVSGMTSTEVYENVMASFEGGTITDFVAVREDGRTIYKKEKRKAYKSEITKGGVILMHDVHTPSIGALPVLLEEFKKKNIQVVPMNTVKEYSFENKTCGLNPNKKF